LHYASLEISLDALNRSILMAERHESVEGPMRYQSLEQHVRTLGFISRATQYATTMQAMMEVN
jgi:hypothetical protein